MKNFLPKLHLPLFGHLAMPLNLGGKEFFDSGLDVGKFNPSLIAPKAPAGPNLCNETLAFCNQSHEPGLVLPQVCGVRFTFDHLLHFGGAEQFDGFEPTDRLTD